MSQNDFCVWQPENGVAIRQGWHIRLAEEGAYRSEGELAGETALIWGDHRNGDRDIFLQVLDSEGEFKFDELGLMVAGGENDQCEPVVHPCNDGGWFVSWIDFVDDTLGNVHCTKINSAGERLWGDDEHGVIVSRHEGTQRKMRIVDDLDGGCIIVWDEYRPTHGIFCMHIMRNGEIDQRWRDNGEPLGRNRGVQGIPSVCSDGRDGVIITWREYTDARDNKIWAQRVTPSGEFLWGGGAGIIVSRMNGEYHSPEICSDGNGGAFIAWEFRRSWRDLDKDIFAHHINSEGELLWEGDGEELCRTNDSQRRCRIISSEDNKAIISWLARSDGDDNGYIYTIKIGGEDRITKEWGDGRGVLLSNIENYRTNPRTASDGAGGAFISVECGRTSESDIRAYHVNSDGELDWQDNGVPVCNAEGQQSSAQILPTPDGCLVTWQDMRSGSSAIISQNLDNEGNFVWESERTVVDSISGYARRVNLLSHRDDAFSLIWEDARRGRDFRAPYFQTCSETFGNQPVLDLTENGIPLRPDTTSGFDGKQAITGADGNIILVWGESRAEEEIISIYAQKYDEEGNILWEENGLRCGEINNQWNRTKICSDGSGGVIVVWHYFEEDTPSINMQRIDENGDQLWGENGIVIDSEEDGITAGAVLPDDDGGAVILYRTFDNSDMWSLLFDLRLNRIDRDGEKLWGENGLLVDRNEHWDQNTTILKRHPDGIVALWDDFGLGDELYADLNIFGQFIDLNGEFLWQDGGFPVCGGDFYQSYPNVAIDNENNIWIVWSDDRINGNQNGWDVYLQKLGWQPDEDGQPQILLNDGDGNPILSGVPVCSAMGNQINTQIVHDAQNGMWIVWEDHRNGTGNKDIYASHFNSEGIPVEGWSENGDPVCSAHRNQTDPLVRLLRRNGETGIVVAWTDYRSGRDDFYSNIYAQRIDDGYVSVPSDTDKPVPVEFSLSAAYPNPFNSRTILTYFIPTETDVVIELYDVNGRLIQQLLTMKLKPGEYQLNINGDNLASGSYIIRMEANKVVLEREIMLIK